LAAGLGRVDEDVLTESDKRRFLEDVKDNFWIKRDNGWLLAEIKAELDGVDGSAKSTSNEEDEDTEVDEEIEEGKRS
jgi:hypothetical protein